jgi:glycerol-3-phosphate acyltransferase PlsY
LSIGQVGLVALAYLLGSMPWGYWIVRVARGEDIRRHGSGNTGATNVWRTFGARLGLATAVLDFLKGFVPALLGTLVYGSGTGVVATAAAMLGHSFPIFLGFGGGKGVATGAGAMLALSPLCFAIAAVVFLAVLWLFRYVSLASMTAAVTIAIAAFATGQPWPVIALTCVGAGAVVLRHRANIGRLRLGQEPRVRSFGRGRHSTAV